MQSNVAFTESQPNKLRVLDGSLVNYGHEPGAVLQLQTGEEPPIAIPVWELDGGLHARFLDVTQAGWAQAYTAFLSSGNMYNSLSPERMGRVRLMGWIGVEEIL